MLKKYPFVKQTGIKDCGAACLLMIIEFYHGYVPLSELRECTKTTKNGTTAYDLLEGAKQVGLDGKGVRLSLSDLTEQQGIFPCIVAVVMEESYEHYMVLYAVKPKKHQVIVGDPATGIRTYSLDEFSKIYRGILLLVYPVRHLPHDLSPKHFLSFCGELLHTSWNQVLFVLLLSVLIMVLSLFHSFYVRNLLVALSNFDVRYLWLMTFLFGSLLLLRLFYEWLRSRLLSFLEMKLDGTLTNHFLKQILALPYSSYRTRTTGELVSRVQEVEAIKTLLSEGMVTIVLDLVLSFLASLVLFSYSFPLFFFSLLLFFLSLIVLCLIHRYWHRKVPSLKEERANVTSSLIESIQGFETIKGLHLEQSFQQTFEQQYVHHLKHLFTFESTNHKFHLFQEILKQGGCFCLFVGASFLAFHQQLSIPDLILIQAILMYLFDPLPHFFSFLLAYEEAKTAFARLLELPHLEQQVGLLCPSIETICLSHVTYPTSNPILNDLSLSLKRGEKVLLLGPSGSGKSTLLKLLKGYLKIEEGSITINETERKHYQEESILKQISYQSQEELLFTDTIAHNILLHRPCLQEQFLELTKLCEVEEIANEKPLGYQTLLEENGFNVSGGQKDRIVLARTFLNETEVYLIDEGFSQMEADMERRILENLFARYQDKLIVLVSHRSDNQDLFDRVLVMEHGTIQSDQRKEGPCGVDLLLPTTTS